MSLKLIGNNAEMSIGIVVVTGPDINEDMREVQRLKCIRGGGAEDLERSL